MNDNDKTNRARQAAAGFADRLARGEFSKSFVIEVSNFLNVPVEKLDELYFFLNALDDRR